MAFMYNLASVVHTMNPIVFFDPLIAALKYLSVMIPLMVVAVVLVNLVTILGYIERFTYLARPVVRWGHLHPASGLSFITAFASPTAANTMLMELYQKGKISKKELFIASMANSFPAMIMHWRSMLPILIPLLGRVGTIYFLLLVLVGLIKTSIILTVGRFVLPPQFKKSFERQINPPKIKGALKKSLIKSLPMLKRILFITIPVTISVFYVIKFHLFDFLNKWLEPIMRFLPLPPQALSIVAAQFAGSLPAYTVASNLLVNHVLNGKQIILSLLIGTVLTSIASMRYLVPYYWGIFGPRLGTQLMLVSQTLRQTIITLVAVAVYYWPK